MRNKLIKLLRNLEKESMYENNYADGFGEEQQDYEVKEHLKFPNYRLIIKRYHNEYPLSKKYSGQVPENKIRSELKRMEMDDLLMISTQEAIKYAYTDNQYEPDYNEGLVFTSESIILTTRGKSQYRYAMYKAKENPIAIIISIIALAVSIIPRFL